ncbi:cell division protein FtsH, partial [Escherichia coli]|nr:cell division protein FtsH [Escherichia coli]
LIRYCYDRAKTIITEHQEQHKLIAETLLKVETLDARQIRSLFDDGVMPPDIDTIDVEAEYPSEKDEEVAGKSFEEEREELKEEEKVEETQEEPKEVTSEDAP